jgi:hypothetical protein
MGMGFVNFYNIIHGISCTVVQHWNVGQRIGRDNFY